MINNEKYKKYFIDFSAGNPEFKQLADIQQEGSIALYNILNKETESIAYLADEVGMGKTFIALGTVMLMRYLNPSLKVLYIAPNRQLKDQWIDEHERFIKNHAKLSDGNIKTFSGESAVPYANCNSLKEVIELLSSGYYADYFVQMNSFSFTLGDNTKNEQEYYKSHLDVLKKYIPAYADSILDSAQNLGDKNEVKQHYALALNYLLPKFDLIVVDEAHKFKNGVETSARNQMLSLILGTSTQNISEHKLNEQQLKIHKKLTSKVLMLSATPFDRNLEHLRNQIELFSGEKLANHYFPKEKGNITFSVKDKEHLINTLKQFLVRRLNKVEIGKDIATRNMYRKEHRSEAIELEGFTQKLVMALVQKHVGDLVEEQTSSPSFQMGLLASFESFSDSAGVKIFDGDDKGTEGKDQARDASLIQQLNNSYRDAKLGQIMPHPKMDAVVNKHSGENFANGEKHLFFVRRVKSVSELVSKWNEKYNDWLKKYLIDAKTSMDWIKLFDDYNGPILNQAARDQTEDENKGDVESSEEGDFESGEVTKDTFFSWFFRGKYLGEGTQNRVDYKDFKINMTKKDHQLSLHFEINWVQYLKIDYDITSDIFKKSYLGYLRKTIARKEFLNKEKFSRYHAAQFAALSCMKDDKAKNIRILMYGNIQYDGLEDELGFNINTIKDDLQTRSIFNELDIIMKDDIQSTFIMKELLLMQFRQDHLMIDLYISLLKVKSNKSDAFIDEFMTIYNDQKNQTNQITSYSIINNAKINIKLICETTLQKFTQLINTISSAGLINIYNRKIHNINLGRFDPVVGVSGDTSDKTLYARKFRLPGYPIVMIATDVMQEGMNLHTFCRSVTHYGLSGTPIHIEQKNGRVDRINSMTHRKIQSREYDSLEAFEHEKIQVRFPFVKQSYEAFQVRRLSNNLNKYLESLHDIDIQNNMDDKVFIIDEINDTSPIPEAYQQFLGTPFEIDEAQKEIPVELCKLILFKRKELKDLVDLLSTHIEKIFGKTVNDDPKKQLLMGEKIFLSLDDKKFNIQLKPARSNGEMLLVFCKNEADPKDGIELLVGSETYLNTTDVLTHEEEIVGAVERLFCKIELDNKLKINLSELKAIRDYWQINNCMPFDRGENTTFTFNENSIVFKTSNDREHKVDLYKIEICKREYVLFYANVGISSEIEIHKTVDIVKFKKIENVIVGYTLHDLKHMQPKEFMYCAYTVALESDLYEYQLSVEDKF